MVTRTLSARYYKDGSEILVSRGKGKNPRRLTPRECARLMGYPKGFKIPVSDTQAYKQFGNSVIVPVISEVARIMKPHIRTMQDLDEFGTFQESLLSSARG
jgi:DNA (cytosine-5)-methyltransferase 1